jgi:hypothetical protein
MVFGTIISSPRRSLSLDKALTLARFYLENARETTDSEFFLVLCRDTEVSISQAKRAAWRTTNQNERNRIATMYFKLGSLLSSKEYHSEGRAFHKKAKKWG